MSVHVPSTLGLYVDLIHVFLLLFTDFMLLFVIPHDLNKYSILFLKFGINLFSYYIQVMSKTCIKYQKPAMPKAVHPGLLCAVGLPGYPHVWNISVTCQYCHQVQYSMLFYS